MQFGFLGIDYKNADLAIRDEISFTDQKKLTFYQPVTAARFIISLTMNNRSKR